MLIKPVGPVILSELDSLENALSRAVADWTRRIVIDMSEVPFLDSKGLELLSGYQRQLTGHGLQLKLSGLTDMVCTILDLTQISDRFQTFPDTSTAIRSFL